MHQNAQRRVFSSSTIPLLVCGATICVPLRSAYASPLDGIMDAAASPVVSFGLGCATGAIVAGLVVGLVGKRSRRSLKSELNEVIAIAERAEKAARRAETLLAERERSTRSVSPARPTHAAQQANVNPVDVVPGFASEGREDSASHVSQTAMPASVEAQTLTGKQHVTPNETSQTPSGKGVRSILQDRIGTNVFGDMPVISRGEVRAEEPSLFSHGPRPRRQFDPAARAAIIDRRIAHFDESLFPDTASEQQAEDDMFEKAMRAMEDSLSVTTATIDEQPTQDLGKPQGRPDVTDPEAYIEYLIQDEMERNRSGQARRYSRAHLTMFEGTGDLSAARRASAYHPRHMREASKEA